ncbi:glycoside hydrolase family 105 protein [Planctomycetota bacterium]
MNKNTLMVMMGFSMLLMIGQNARGDEFKPEDILGRMQKAAQWQLANPFGYHRLEWHCAPFYMGLSDLSEVTGDPQHIDAAKAIGEKYDWKLGRRHYHADDHAVGQVYLKLYQRDQDAKMVSPLNQRFDWILSNPAEQTYWADYTRPELEQRKWPGWRDFKQERWSWCDALYMAPPVWAGLWKKTGEQKYLDYMVKEWQQTHDWLWDDEIGLYYRDKNYIDRLSPAGKKIFWSRGNGWVFAGLVEVLQYLPKNHPHRATFEKIFLRMAASLKTLQMDNGIWAPSLLDPTHTPQDETSGTAFYVYGMAWGINNGLLERSEYEPTIRKAWLALCERQKENGRLINVQPVGARPEGFDPDSTVIYGMGAFISAGSEIYKLMHRQH